MTKNQEDKAKTKKMADQKNISPTQRIGSMTEDDVASAVLRVVGEDVDGTYPEVDSHPTSLDLPRRAPVRREKAAKPTSSPRR
jgi:hypothetical protein